VHALTRRGAGVLGLALAAAAPAHAAPCGRPDLVDMIPPDGATSVPPNATLAAHYQTSAEYLGEEVVLVAPDGTVQALPATFDGTEGLLAITPPDPLTPGGAYVVRWPVLRALASATPGTGGEARFTVGAGDDTEAPAFEGVVAASWDLERKPNECTDEIAERFVFDVRLGAASDDGGRDGLALLLFQTSGPSAGASVPVHARALPAADSATVRVALTPREALGRICFAGMVRDMTGKISNGADRQACVGTTEPPFFSGCGVAPAPTGRTPWWAIPLLTLTCRARRGRPRP
jgi:hypothetical protein